MSETMVRKQVYIRRDQDERLKAAAAASGKTESELIREAVDVLAPAPWNETLVAPIVERTASTEEIERRKRDRGWRREDIYWDRMRIIQRMEQADRDWIASLLARQAPGRGPIAAKPKPRFDREEAYAERLRRLLD